MTDMELEIDDKTEKVVSNDIPPVVEKVEYKNVIPPTLQTPVLTDEETEKLPDIADIITPPVANTSPIADIPPVVDTQPVTNLPPAITPLTTATPPIVGAPSVDNYLFNKVKDLELSTLPNASNYVELVGEEHVGGTTGTTGLDYDYLYVGVNKVTPPEKTTNFLKVMLSGSCTWVAAMPETQDTDSVVFDVTKNRIYIHGAFGG